MSRVIKVKAESIEFDDGYTLESDHESDCCEHHWLSFGDLTLADFAGLEFDLSGDAFFERVPDYGIRLLPTLGHALSVPGYAGNNGYYSPNLTLMLHREGEPARRYDITECQTDA